MRLEYEVSVDGSEPIMGSIYCSRDKEPEVMIKNAVLMDAHFRNQMINREHIEVLDYKTYDS